MPPKTGLPLLRNGPMRLLFREPQQTGVEPSFLWTLVSTRRPRKDAPRINICPPLHVIQQLPPDLADTPPPLRHYPYRWLLPEIPQLPGHYPYRLLLPGFASNSPLLHRDCPGLTPR